MGMKAASRVIASDIGDNGQKEITGKRPIEADRLYARLRRLEQRLSYCEEKLSTLRRDVNRIDRREYREQELQPKKTNKPPFMGGMTQEGEYPRIV